MRYCSCSSCQRNTGSAVLYARRSSCHAPMWCHQGWMPPAIPSIIHMRASFGGLAERRKVGAPHLVQGHALRQELVPTKQTVHEFTRVAVLLKSGLIGARLVIE